MPLKIPVYFHLGLKSSAQSLERYIQRLWKDMYLEHVGEHSQPGLELLLANLASKQTAV